MYKIILTIMRQQHDMKLIVSVGEKREAERGRRYKRRDKSNLYQGHLLDAQGYRRDLLELLGCLQRVVQQRNKADKHFLHAVQVAKQSSHVLCDYD